MVEPSKAEGSINSWNVQLVEGLRLKRLAKSICARILREKDIRKVVFAN